MGFTLAGLVMLGLVSRLNIRRSPSPPHRVDQALKASTSSSPSTVSLSPKHRILCYGDSLTAGTSGMEEYPYATHLEKGIDNVQVLHRGLPGWTANGMLMDLDGERTGLRAALQRLKQQSTDDEHIHPISLVILLAGTNDMGYGFDDEEITEDLKRLHEVCFENDVPRTIAIGVPPSGYQSMVATAAELAHRVNDSLELFCQESQGKSTYVDFPFEYEKGGVNWNIDTLHFSKEGYKLLGESLVPTVRTVLQSLERSNQPSV